MLKCIKHTQDRVKDRAPPHPTAPHRTTHRTPPHATAPNIVLTTTVHLKTRNMIASGVWSIVFGALYVFSAVRDDLTWFLIFLAANNGWQTIWHLRLIQVAGKSLLCLTKTNSKDSTWFSFCGGFVFARSKIQVISQTMSCDWNRFCHFSNAIWYEWALSSSSQIL